jgi:hypothetical protein
MGGTIEGKFRILHTVKDQKKLGAVAGRLGITTADKKARLKEATRKIFIVEEIKGHKTTKNRKEEPEG